MISTPRDAKRKKKKKKREEKKKSKEKGKEKRKREMERNGNVAADLEHGLERLPKRSLPKAGTWELGSP
jgi:hypothetical protein